MKFLEKLKFKYIDCYFRVKVGDCFVVIRDVSGFIKAGDIFVVETISRSETGKCKSYNSHSGAACGSFRRRLYKKI